MQNCYLTFQLYLWHFRSFEVHVSSSISPLNANSVRLRQNNVLKNNYKISTKKGLADNKTVFTLIRGKNNRTRKLNIYINFLTYLLMRNNLNLVQLNITRILLSTPIVHDGLGLHLKFHTKRNG